MRSKGWSVVLGGIAVVSLAATIPLSVFAHLLGDGVVALVIGVPCMAIGFLVARRQPRNPLGWLFLVIAIFLFVPTSVVHETLEPAHTSLWISPHA